MEERGTAWHDGAAQGSGKRRGPGKAQNRQRKGIRTNKGKGKEMKATGEKPARKAILAGVLAAAVMLSLALAACGQPSEKDGNMWNPTNNMFDIVFG